MSSRHRPIPAAQSAGIEGSASFCLGIPRCVYGGEQTSYQLMMTLLWNRQIMEIMTLQQTTTLRRVQLFVDRFF
jgi:hypothetical protein